LALLDFNLEEFASEAALARVVGLITLLGFRAFLILNTAQAVPIACPAASSPSFVTFPADSPYLQLRNQFIFSHLNAPMKNQVHENSSLGQFANQL
jgi:hypothetical protein